VSMLSRAAGRFDTAFAAQPAEVQRAVALAIYRAAPAFAQYQKDLAPLAEDPEILDAMWDLMIAFGFRLATKGKDAIKQKQLDEIRDAAPRTAEFIGELSRMLAGAMPGVFPALPAARAPRELGALGPDEKTPVRP
jgi:hypothetical protein